MATALRSLADIVVKLAGVLQKDNAYEMIVRRSHVLSNALCSLDRLSFDPKKKLMVCTF